MTLVQYQLHQLVGYPVFRENWKTHNTETGTPSNYLPRQVALFDRNPEMLFAGIPVKR